MLTVAQIQFTPELGNCKVNTDIIAGFLEECKHADLIILPELANSGYNFPNFNDAMEIANSKHCITYIEFLQEFANTNNVHIVSGYLEKSGSVLYNSSVYIKPNEVPGNYRKLHLFLNEKDIFKPGDVGLPIFEINSYKFGMLICFDYLFTEIWRIMALKGADFVVHPSNLITENAFITVPALALTNGYYIFTTNRTGTEGDITFCGSSFSCDQKGKVISKLGAEDQSILISKIDPTLSRNKMITKRNHIIKDRRIEYYGDLLK